MAVVLTGEANVSMVVRAGLLLVLCACATAAAQAQVPVVEVVIVAVDPPGTFMLPRGELLSARVRYKSDIPLRFQMEGHWHTKTVQASRLNPAPAYPAGEGEAIAWIAYNRSASVDEIVVKVWDKDWKPLTDVRRTVLIDWSEGDGRRERAGWVNRLNAEQQDMASRALAAHDEDAEPGNFLMLLLPVGLFGYFFLQPWALRRLDGSWHIAALVPLAVTIPLGLHAIIALMAGSNLWPLLLIFSLPIATLYLLVLVGVHAFIHAE